MHIDRHCHVMPVVLHHVGDHGRQHAVPVFGLGDRVEISQHAFVAPFLNARPFDLRRCWRVARHDAGLEYRHGALATTTGDSKIFPGMAARLEHLFQLSSRGRFTARRPPVQDFDFGRLSGK